MSAFQGGGCKAESYGSYSSCAACGVNAYRTTWNSMDPCLPNGACSQTSPPGRTFTPDERCDFQERNSRNIYDWKKAFNYGSALDYGKQGAGCIYMGSITDTNASFPWGYQGKYFKDASYASYTGDLDKSRKNPYQVKVKTNNCLDQNSCGYDVGVRDPHEICDGGSVPSLSSQPSQFQKSNQYSIRNIPFVSYEEL